MKDVLKVPESFFMLYDTIVAFDHFFNVCKVITYLRVPSSNSQSELSAAYEKASDILQKTVSRLQAEHIPLPPQPPIAQDQPSKSNAGQEGYEAFVTQLKKHINRGNIIQTVPSHRIARPTTLHPFNIYRHLRTVSCVSFARFDELPWLSASSFYS